MRGTSLENGREGQGRLAQPRFSPSDLRLSPEGTNKQSNPPSPTPGPQSGGSDVRLTGHRAESHGGCHWPGADLGAGSGEEVGPAPTPV